MFIYVTYKDAPELSNRHSLIDAVDTSVEKSLLVNPDCPVRIMLEYIRKHCHLGAFTHFDLCDETGCLMGLFNLKTYAYATDRFEHKKNYYVIVYKMEFDKQLTILPQLNRENRLFTDLQQKVRTYISICESSFNGSCPGRSAGNLGSNKPSPVNNGSLKPNRSKKKFKS